MKSSNNSGQKYSKNKQNLESFRSDLQLNRILKEIKYSLLNQQHSFNQNSSYTKSQQKPSKSKSSVAIQTEEFLAHTLFQEQIKISNTKITALKEEQNRLRQKCSSLNQELIRFDEKFRIMTREKDGLQITINQLELGIIRTSDEMSRYKAQMRLLKNENLDLMDQVKMIDRLKEELETKRKIIFAVKGVSHDVGIQCEPKNKQNTGIQTEEPKRKQIIDIQCECILAEQQQQKLEETIDSMTVKLHEKDQQMGRLRSQLKQELFTLTTLQEQLQTTEEENIDLRSKIFKLQKDCEDREAQLAEKIQRFIQNKFKKTEKDKKGLEKQLTELHDRTEKLFNENVDAKQRIMQLEVYIDRQEQVYQRAVEEIKKLHEDEMQSLRYNHTLEISDYELKLREASYR